LSKDRVQPRQPLQLRLVKDLYDKASRLVEVGTAFDRLQSVLFLDLSVELALNVIIQDLENEPPDGQLGASDIKWSRLWQRATKAAKEATSETHLPRYSDLSRLRQIRNLAQHNGTIPDITEARRYVAPSRSFHEFVFSKIYGQNFARFSLTDVVVNGAVKDFLHAAEELASEGKSQWAMAAAQVLHDRLLRSFDTYLDPEAGTIDGIRYALEELSRDIEHNFEISIERELEKLGESIGKEIANVRRENLLYGLGLRPEEVLGFRRAGAGLNVWEYQDGSVQIASRREGSGEESRDNALEMLEYVTRLALLIEAYEPRILENLVLRKSPREFAS